MRPVILVIGPSGVGKSTLLHNALAAEWPAPWRVGLIGKETTRDLRGPAEQRECRHVTPDLFQERAGNGDYLIHYEVFQERYGLLRHDFSEPAEHMIYLQTLPTDISAATAALLKPPWRPAIVHLEADPRTVRERLLRRGDQATLRTLEQRMSTVGRDRRSTADVTIQAEDERQTLGDFARWALDHYALR